jgi:hypothetical protein
VRATTNRAEQYNNMDATQHLLSACRTSIVTTRIQLACDHGLSAAQCSELWQIIDAQENLIRMVAKDYEGELEKIDRQLEAELSRPPRSRSIFRQS